MKDNLLLAGDYNVIIVDWSKGNGLPYTQATANTRVVGAEIALVIKTLQVFFNSIIMKENFNILLSSPASVLLYLILLSTKHMHIIAGMLFSKLHLL